MSSEQRWPELARRQARIRAQAEERVVESRWTHGKGWAHRAQLYFNERSEFSPVRLKRQRPDDVEGWIEYGFDDRGRCVLIRQHAFGRSYQDEVIVYSEDRDEVLEFQ